MLQKDGESDAEDLEFVAGSVERDSAILDNPAYDAIEIVYAGKFSVADEERLQGGLAGPHVVRLPWVILNNQGILHFLDGDIQGALKCYMELNERIPCNIIFMYRQGLCHVLKGFKSTRRNFLGFEKPDRAEVGKGILLFRKCIRLGETRSIGRQRCLLIRKFLADAWSLGHKRRAAKVWREILKLEPHSVEAVFRVKGALRARDLLRARKKASRAKTERLLLSPGRR